MANDLFWGKWTLMAFWAIGPDGDGGDDYPLELIIAYNGTGFTFNKSNEEENSINHLFIITFWNLGLYIILLSWIIKCLITNLPIGK